ncbi:MAG: Rieske 2Fe-2S domain-containing protein [Sporichthyaceae bacterium]
MNPFDSVTVLEDATPLDKVTAPVRDGVLRLLGNGIVRDALHGVWLGHPLHPVLVQVPIGAFMSAAILDLMPGEGKAADTLIATGMLATWPAAASGLADWSQMHEQQQRVGIVHAAANTVATVLYGASLVARRRGNRGAGKVWAMAGLGVLGFSGFLGGHLAFRQAAGANHNEAVPHLVPPGWHDLCALDDLAGDGVPQFMALNTVPLLVVRRGERIDVLSDRCSHLAGPLHEGTVSGDGSCITCPWHGSTFSLEDGSVRNGPATAPQHAFDVRVDNGRVEVRLPGAGG